MAADAPMKRLGELGLTLPRMVAARGNLLGFKIDGDRVFVSGQLPLLDGHPKYVGKVGDMVSPEQGHEAAQLAALNALGQLSQASGGRLETVEIVKLSGFVNCVPEFTEIGAVIDGASDLLTNVLGERGKHARFAIGVASLPRGVAVEVDIVARLHNGAAE